MKKVFRPLLLLHPDPSLRERVRAACGDDYEVVELEDWSALEEAIGEAPPSAMVMVDPWGEARVAGRRPLAPELRELMARYPSTAVVAVLAVGPETQEQLRQLGRWGVVQIIASGHDDTVEAGSMLRRAVLMEAGVLVVVLGVTGFLVDQPPQAGAGSTGAGSSRCFRRRPRGGRG